MTHTKPSPADIPAALHFRLSSDGTRELVIIKTGPQQSICRWLDSGDEICVCNSWLVPVGRLS